jgi:hypothetical protein
MIKYFKRFGEYVAIKKEVQYEMDLKSLSSKKLFIATPMYGGNCGILYANSMVGLTYICGNYKIPIEWYFSYNDALITRARNKIVHDFLKSDADYLMFIDGDIEFKPRDVLCLSDLASKNENMQIITGSYPRKSINWERIRMLCENSEIKEAAEIENYIGEYVFNTKSNKNTFPLDKPFKVQEAGTGFMLIKREVFEKFEKAYPEQTYREYKTNEKIVAYFDCKIDPKSEKYLSEDYMFCQYAANIGIDTWLVPWINLNHMGSYLFKGSFAMVASMDYQSGQ